MPETKLWQMFECVGPKTEIFLSHRESDTAEWEKTVGTKTDPNIKKWENCIVAAVKWEENRPGIQIAVRGKPNERGV